MKFNDQENRNDVNVMMQQNQTSYKTQRLMVNKTNINGQQNTNVNVQQNAKKDDAK